MHRRDGLHLQFRKPVVSGRKNACWSEPCNFHCLVLMGPSAALAEEQALEVVRGLSPPSVLLSLFRTMVLSCGTFVLLVFLSEDMGDTKAYMVMLESWNLQIAYSCIIIIWFSALYCSLHRSTEWLLLLLPYLTGFLQDNVQRPWLSTSSFSSLHGICLRPGDSGNFPPLSNRQFADVPAVLPRTLCQSLSLVRRTMYLPMDF